MEYKRIFIESWEALCERAKIGNFTPHQEQDIIGMMYSLCLDKIKNPKLIHVYSTWNYDMILGELKAEKHKDQNISHCLIAEFKFILKESRKKRKLEEATDDISRLAQEDDSTVRKIFCIFDKSDSLNLEDAEILESYGGNVTILFYPNLI